ncbi:MAG: transposase [Algicola sp.]|nr:transposase [Algicola sp.]
MQEGHKLRTHRYSSTGQIYCITSATHQRCCYFHDFALARKVVKAMQYQDEQGKTQTLAFVIMPDHIHWLFELKQGSLHRIMQSVKSFSAQRFGAPLWQSGYYERTLRKSDDIIKFSRYIVANPLRAGLVEHIGDYPLWDAIWLES